MSYKITTIIPVYNAETTIEKAVNSILNQKWEGNISEDLEIIIVDDCSTDNSINIIKKLTKKHSNIKPIFLKENTGSPSIPRNAGIENCTGKYLLFLDSDDMFVDNAFITVYDIMENNEADIIHFDQYDEINNEIFKFKNTQNDKKYKTLEPDEKLYLRYTSWGNLFKTSFLKENNITFYPKILHEDGIFAMKSYILGKVIKTSYYGYIYNISSDSITHKVNLNKLIMYFEGIKIFNKILKEHNLQNLEYKIMPGINILFYFMFLKLNASKKEKINILKEFKEFNDEITGEIIINSKPIEILNNFVKKENYQMAIIYSNIIGLIYKNQKIKDFIFKNYSNLEKVEVK